MTFFSVHCCSSDAFNARQLNAAAASHRRNDDHTPQMSPYLVMGLDLCTFSHQHLNDLDVATTGCDQEGRSPVLEYIKARVIVFIYFKVFAL